MSSRNSYGSLESSDISRSAGRNGTLGYGDDAIALSPSDPQVDGMLESGSNVVGSIVVVLKAWMAAPVGKSKSGSGVAGSTGASTHPIIIAMLFVAPVIERTDGGVAMNRLDGTPINQVYSYCRAPYKIHRC